MTVGEPVPPESTLDAADANDRAAALYARHRSTVLGICRLLLRHPQEAEDAAQQVFLSAYRSLLGGIAPRHPAAWLATIARNECCGRIQRRSRDPLPSGESDVELPDPVAEAAARADLDEVWRAIGGLPVKQREALVLREFSGLSYAELAQALSVSEPAIESLLFRARTALRVKLQPVYASAAGLLPIAAIREALGLARIAAAPAVAKTVVGAAAIVVAGGTVAVVEHDSSPRGGAPASSPVARAPVAQAAIPPESALRAPSRPAERTPKLHAGPAPQPEAAHHIAGVRPGAARSTPLMPASESEQASPPASSPSSGAADSPATGTAPAARPAAAAAPEPGAAPGSDVVAATSSSPTADPGLAAPPAQGSEPTPAGESSTDQGGPVGPDVLSTTDQTAPEATAASSDPSSNAPADSGSPSREGAAHDHGGD